MHDAWMLEAMRSSWLHYVRAAARYEAMPHQQEAAAMARRFARQYSADCRRLYTRCLSV